MDFGAAHVVYISCILLSYVSCISNCCKFTVWQYARVINSTFEAEGIEHCFLDAPGPAELLHVGPHLELLEAVPQSYGPNQLRQDCPLFGLSVYTVSHPCRYLVKLNKESLSDFYGFIK